MNLVRSSIKIFAAKAVGSFIVLLGITYFARELGSHRMGIFFLFQALLGMIAIPADLGITNGVAKRISEGESPGAVLSTAVLLKLLPISLFAGGIILLRHPVNEYLGGKLAIYLAVALVLQELAKLMIQTLMGELRVGETAVPTLSRQVVYVGVGGLLVLMGFGVMALIYGLLAGLTIKLAWGTYLSSTTLRRPSLAHARSLFDYSKYAFISSVGAYFYSWMDVAVIGLFLTQSHVGIYEIAWQVTAVTMLFSGAIATTIFPQVSQWDAEDATERIENLLSEAIAPSLFFVVPAFFGVLLFSREILGLVFGSEFEAGWLVLIILMGEKVLQSVHIVLGRSLQGINRPDLAAKAGIVAMILNLVLNVVLVLQYGIVGAAVATAFSFVVNSFLHAYYLSRFVSIKIPYRRIGGTITASLGMTVLLWGVKSSIVVRSLPRLGIVILLGIALYGIFTLLIPASREMVLDNVKRVVS